MAALLTAYDSLSFQLVHGGDRHPFLLICDHAGNRVPQKLGNLGLTYTELERHIAFDRGAAEVTKHMADMLGVSAVLANYSRLVIDCNRSADHEDLIPQQSDGTIIKGNKKIRGSQRQARIDEIYVPYQKAVKSRLEQVDRKFSMPATLVAIHSFTPKLKTKGKPRPWHIGVSWKEDKKTARALIEYLRRDENLVVGDNEPYALKNTYTLLENSQNGRPNVLIEIRKDEISTPQGQKHYAKMLSRFFQPSQ